MPTHELGQFTLEDNGTDFLIKDENGNTRAKYDVSTDTWELTPAISTTQLFNDEESGIDFSELPFALPLSRGYYRQVNWHSLDGLQATTSGGSVAVNFSNLRCKTSSTSGNWARATANVYRDSATTSDAIASYDDDIAFSGTFEIRDADGSRLSYLTMGRVEENNKGFGIKLDNGDIEGVVHNGTSETTTTLVSNPGSGRVQFTVAYRAGTDVTFYIDGRDSSDGTISSGLPSGDTNEAGRVQAYAETQTSATRNLFVYSLEYAQGV